MFLALYIYINAVYPYTNIDLSAHKYALCKKDVFNSECRAFKLIIWTSILLRIANSGNDCFLMISTFLSEVLRTSR